MNSQSKLSALSFVRPEENFYQKYFFSVLELIIFSHRLMLEQEKNIDGLDEDVLSNKLIKYIRNNRGGKFGLGQFVFDRESAESDEKTDVNVGYTDIKITIPTKSAFSSEEQKYYTIECKRLDGYAEKNKYYIENGIFRFISGKYSNKMNLAGMVGFVESSKRKFKGDKITSIVSDINTKLANNFNKPNEQLKNVVIAENFSNSYKSTHNREKNLGSIDITHLLFDNTQITD